MFSLPNINKMNEQAVQEWAAKEHKTTKQRLRGKTCEWCDEPATVLYDWYDIYSDVPKGEITLCDKHDHYYGSPSEGYFTCDCCGRVFAENYTWELFYTLVNDCEQVCLNCALDMFLNNPDNKITIPDQITVERLHKSPHLIPVNGTYHEDKLDFHGNVEFDSLDGHCISGGGLKELQEIAQQAIKEHGYCYMVLDSAYQFAVSIGIYTKKSMGV